MNGSRSMRLNLHHPPGVLVAGTIPSEAHFFRVSSWHPTTAAADFGERYWSLTVSEYGEPFASCQESLALFLRNLDNIPRLSTARSTDRNVSWLAFRGIVWHCFDFRSRSP